MFIEYRVRFEPDGVRISQQIEAGGPGSNPSGGPGGFNPPGVPGGNPPGVPGGFNPPGVPGGNPPGVPGGLGGNSAGGSLARGPVANSNGGYGGGGSSDDVAVVLGPVIIRQPSLTTGLAQRTLRRKPEQRRAQRSPKQDPKQVTVYSAHSASEPAQHPVVELEFTMQPQERDNWCWAAIAVSIADNFRSPARTPDSQCVLAARVLGAGNCCTSGQTPESCDVPLPLETALNAAGVPCRVTDPLPDFEAVAAQIDQNKPFCVRIGPTKGQLGIGHFLVVHGYWRAPSGKNYVILSDPGGATRRRMTLEEFRNNFHLEGNTLGTWTHTYLF